MEKLLAAADFAQRIYGRYLFRHFLVWAVIVAILAIASSIMASAALISGFYVAYVALQHYGVGTLDAAFITGFLLVLTTLVLGTLTTLSLRHVRCLPKTLLRQSPAAARACETVEAFLDGFMKEEA